MVFEIPKQRKKYTKVLSDFLGVDFTSAVPSERRASYMKNLINNDGYLETRPGYAAIGYNFGANNINGVWNVDKDGTNIFVAHVGTKLYTLDSAFLNPVDISPASAMGNVISQGVYVNDKLIIFDGVRTVIYGEFSSVWEAKYLDTIGYVPTTVISRSPDGTGSASYEEVNLIQPYRINSFLADGASATFVLDSEYDDEEPTVTILQSDGTIADLTVLSYDHEAATVTLTAIPPVSPVDGRDNVFVRFKVTNSETLPYINKATITTMFGYQGNNDRLFVTGNPDYPNVDWFSESNDATYFPASNYTRVGFQPIVNYLRLNDGTLAILKDISDTDSTIYYRKSALYNGQEVFPIEAGVKTIGCVSKYACANLLNDPLMLSDLGVFGITGSDYNEKFANERSYFIKKPLVASTLSTAIAIVYKEKYYLAVGGVVYVADSRYKSKAIESNNSTYQYEWYYWTNLPVRMWFIYNDTLYFGTATGRIMAFNTNPYDLTNTAIDQEFYTTILDLGSAVERKTIKQLTVTSTGPVSSTPADNAREAKLVYYTNEDAEAEQTIVTRTFTNSTIPVTLQEKEKIKNIMYIVFGLTSSSLKKLNFYQMVVEYVYSGRYKG